MSIKRWDILKTDAVKSAGLSAMTGLDSFVCDILQARGIDTPEQAKAFFSDELADPYLIVDMDKAVERINSALENGEKICVYGDYDCDGITSTVLLYNYLQNMGAQVSYYIPDRDGEGYGMNMGAVERLAQQGVTLIITVDNGVSALEEIDYAATLGVDVVVTDHHKPRETLPNAVAVVDPHRSDCTAPFVHFAGVGVVFKLICALEGGDGLELLDYYGDLTCIGTIADIVPLTGENRTLARFGLERLQYTDNIGLRALFEVSGLGERRVTCENVGFMLAPRINAAGRLGFTQKAVDLLLCEDPDEAHQLAQEITEQNKARQGMELQILKDISRELSGSPQLLQERLLVLSGEGWHHGIIGIVCSKMMERYAKPCLLISVEGGEARGSGRSIEGFSLVEAVSACSEHLTRYGGHAAAAGFSLEAGQVDAFKAKLLANAKRDYMQMPVMTVRIDRQVDPAELTVENFKKLSVLEPFGAENELPVFAVMGVRIEAVYPMGNDGGHLRLRLSKDRQSFYAVYFGMAKERFPYEVGDCIDIAVNCDINFYNNEERLSVRIKTLRPQGIGQDALFYGIRQYECYQRGEEWQAQKRADLVPEREDVAAVYRWLRGNKGYTGDLELLGCKLAPMNYCKLRISLDALEELGLIRRAPAKLGVAISLCEVKEKTDLARSTILQRLADC